MSVEYWLICGQAMGYVGELASATTLANTCGANRKRDTSRFAGASCLFEGSLHWAMKTFEFPGRYFFVLGRGSRPAPGYYLCFGPVGLPKHVFKK